MSSKSANSNENSQVRMVIPTTMDDEDTRSLQPLDEEWECSVTKICAIVSPDYVSQLFTLACKSKKPAPKWIRGCILDTAHASLSLTAPPKKGSSSSARSPPLKSFKLPPSPALFRNDYLISVSLEYDGIQVDVVGLFRSIKEAKTFTCQILIHEASALGRFEVDQSSGASSVIARYCYCKASLSLNLRVWYNVMRIAIFLCQEIILTPQRIISGLKIPLDISYSSAENNHPPFTCNIKFGLPDSTCPWRRLRSIQSMTPSNTKRDAKEGACAILYLSILAELETEQKKWAEKVKSKVGDGEDEIGYEAKVTVDGTVVSNFTGSYTRVFGACSLFSPRTPFPLPSATPEPNATVVQKDMHVPVKSASSDNLISIDKIAIQIGKSSSDLSSIELQKSDSLKDTQPIEAIIKFPVQGAYQNEENERGLEATSKRKRDFSRTTEKIPYIAANPVTPPSDVAQSHQSLLMARFVNMPKIRRPHYTNRVADENSSTPVYCASVHVNGRAFHTTASHYASPQEAEEAVSLLALNSLFPGWKSDHSQSVVFKRVCVNTPSPSSIDGPSNRPSLTRAS